MKKINFLYLAIIPLIYLLFQMNSSLSQASAFFYGFAENKETELSHDKAVLVHKILVTPGQAVTKGQLLMEVKQSNIDFKIDNASLDLERLGVVAQQERQGIKDRIEQLKARRLAKVTELELEVKNLEATIAYNQSLLKDLKSIDPAGMDAGSNPNTVKLAALQEQLKLVTEPIDLEITQLQNELRTIEAPSLVQQEKIKSEIDYYKTEQEKLAIIAPSDGIIGNILCKEGENISSFSTLINFYERNPTLVKGFVHESLILEVQEGDSLIVSSSLHLEQKISGVVIGLGSRIVEIPERLRKVPELKTYGREVLIRIPSTNSFLQKEKVMLNSLTGESANSLAYMLTLFQKEKVNKKEEKKIRKAIVGKK